ncbi:MAG: TonB family protein, partial [Rhodocyclaceae bacterium]|nr:TonB family protein [Rhodocyclaceae bacterium]
MADSGTRRIAWALAASLGVHGAAALGFAYSLRALPDGGTEPPAREVLAVTLLPRDQAGPQPGAAPTPADRADSTSTVLALTAAAVPVPAPAAAASPAEAATAMDVPAPARPAADETPARSMAQPARAEVAIAAVPIDEVSPIYPPEAYASGLSADVELEVDIDAEGRVTSARVLSSSAGEVFDAAARQAAYATRFQPA